MKLIQLRRGALIASLGLGWSAAVADEESKFEIQASYGVHSRYVWRGVELESRPNFQIGTSITSDRFSLDIFSLSRTAFPLFNSADELDFDMSWAMDWQGWQVVPFVSVFTYPNDTETENTTEIGLSLGKEAGAYGYYLDQYLDVDDASGAYYLELGAMWFHQLSDRSAGGLGVSGGWGNAKFHRENFGVNKSAGTVASASAFLEIGLDQNVSLRPEVRYDRLLDRRLRDSGARKDNVTLSLTISKAW